MNYNKCDQKTYAFNSAKFDFFLASTKSIISHQWQYDIAIEKENTVIFLIYLKKKNSQSMRTAD